MASRSSRRRTSASASGRDGLRRVDVLDELDVSGGKPLDERPGLGPAVRAVEGGKADVIAAGYFDRLFRSLAVQAEVVERVERAGGRVLAVDAGTPTALHRKLYRSGTSRTFDGLARSLRRTQARARR